MVWDINAPYKAESKKIVWEVTPYLRGKGLDIGAGDFKVLPHVISVDNFNHQQFGFQVKPDIMAEADNLSIFSDQSMDFVYSSHTLEHVHDYRATLKEWWRLVKVDGYLVLYLPHKAYYPNMGQAGANPDHKHDFLPSEIIEAMPAGWDLLEHQERNEDDEYSFLLVFKRLQGNKRRHSYLAPRPVKTACVVRYGAFGDLMQSSSVWAGLKAQGFHVTVFSSLPGAGVVAHDPNIDNLVLFDKDQVPNANLVDFWNWQKKRFTRWVNLSESVEGTFLAMPGRTPHTWAPLVRHKRMNENYVQFQHELAGLPHEPRIKFYATEAEKEWAKSTRKKMGKGPIVVWSLAGSSVHKTWAGLDPMLASFMLNYPDMAVVLVGGPECVMLEAGWENEQRIVKTSGKWSIRQSLSFLEQADLVIGPETGVLNAAANLEVPKVVFLSHSTHDNLTRDWTNVYPLASVGTVCPGRGNDEAPACHQLHYGFTNCKMDKLTGTAQCQADIPEELVWQTIQRALDEHLRNI
jgi:ADP-heptose:LPS heptosyltransferase/predicted SAM-dependent methyltransferase